MAAVALHPLASRSGVQSATVVTVDLPDATPRLVSDDIQHHYNLSSSSTARSPSPNPVISAPAAAYAESVTCEEEEDQDLDDDQHAEEQAVYWQEDGERVEYGLIHDDLDQYPVLLGNDEGTQEPVPPIRAMTAAQFARIQQQYADLDVPHSVVFPFLHGVDGDNAAQNFFFRAPLRGMPTPFYRGLTVLRADMPTQEQQYSMNRKRASSSASKLSHADGNPRSRADSIATTASGFSNDDSSSGSEEENTLPDLPAALKPSQLPISKSTTSVSSLNTRSDHSRTSSLFSRAMSSETSSSSFCTDNDAYKNAGSTGYPARNLQNRNSQHRTSSHEPQPAHSMLYSTMMPAELLNPPLMANLNNNHWEVAKQSSVYPEEYSNINRATFIKAKQADGISLRNFKTQSTKYATISDIVIYCPAGLHQGVLTLAKWARQAQETCFHERVARGLGGLRYNVFVITGESPRDTGLR
jgi:dual specificity MAP kinase phosphatase